MIGIVDYGAGNLASVKNAFGRLGIEAEPFSDPSKTPSYEKLILPGVGSFASAMQQLNSQGWPAEIQQHVQEKKPLLGICLGMQLLFEIGEENGKTQGLGLLRGKVIEMQAQQPLKIPHVGWNKLIPAREHPVMARIKERVDFYFVHSYHCVPEDKGDILARVEHGRSYVASVARESVIGIQFHPEKSQPTGLKILKNFDDWDGIC